ncbi:MAG: hypothetical protein KF812_13310 [Fimbriimonadaceae bacterium]|nr:hypothetical protein [Fimbriimonadaceae bacterium]
MRNRFSAQFTIAPDGRPLERNVAPEPFRAVVVALPLTLEGIYAKGTREALCRGLKKLPDSQNWSKDNIVSEVHSLIQDAEWYQVYDGAEAIADEILRRHMVDEYALYEEELNRTLEECSVGWRMVNARFEVRGDEAVQAIQDRSLTQIAESGLTVATSEMKEAIADLSRRPEPDLSGAVTHAYASLESIAKHCTNETKGTFGDILKWHPNLLPEPLKSAAEKFWGFASENARHAKEGRRLDTAEVEMAVGAAAVLSSFLLRRLSSGGIYE